MVLGVALACLLAQAPDARPGLDDVDLSRSTLTVHVKKAGLLSPELHDHLFVPSKWKAELHVREGTASFEIDAASLHDTEPGLSDADKKKVDAETVGPEILDAVKYPTIRFHSTSYDPKTGGLDGELELHGEKHPVHAKVQAGIGSFRGHATFKYTDFGIPRYRKALGAIAIEDELEIDVNLVMAATRNVQH